MVIFVDLIRSSVVLLVLLMELNLVSRLFIFLGCAQQQITPLDLQSSFFSLCAQLGSASRGGGVCSGSVLFFFILVDAVTYFGVLFFMFDIFLDSFRVTTDDR